MKITKARLKQIIKEELSEISSASGYSGEDAEMYDTKKKLSAHQTCAIP